MISETGVEFDLFNLPPEPSPAPVSAIHPAELSTAAKFEAYHAENPIVLETLIREARRWMREFPGRKLGMSLLIGRVRWVLTLQVEADADGFKINDHYAPAYARLAMHVAPDLEGLFDLRRTLWADAWIEDLKAREGNGQAAA